MKKPPNIVKNKYDLLLSNREVKKLLKELLVGLFL